MKQFSLPLLQGTMSLTDAIESLRASDSRACIAKVGHARRLITNRDLRDGWIKGVRTLAQIDTHGPELLIGLSPEPHLDVRILAEGEVTLLESAHEYIADRVLFATKVCICSKNSSHTCDSPPAQDGQPCEYCSGQYICF